MSVRYATFRENIIFELCFIYQIGPPWLHSFWVFFQASATAEKLTDTVTSYIRFLCWPNFQKERPQAVKCSLASSVWRTADSSLSFTTPRPCLLLLLTPDEMFSSPAHTYHFPTQLDGRPFHLTPGSAQGSKQSENKKAKGGKKAEKGKTSWHWLATVMKACLRGSQCCSRLVISNLICEKWHEIVLLHSCFVAKLCFPRLFQQDLNLNSFMWTDIFPLYLLWLCKSCGRIIVIPLE